MSHEKKPPRGRVHSTPAGIVRSSAASSRCALARVERARALELLVDPAAPRVLLEEPLAERAGALVGVLLRGHELRDDLRGPGRPAEPHAREERLRRRARPARRRRARGSRGSPAPCRRSRARGRRRPRRSGSRSGARARRARRGARPTASRRPGSGGPGSCRGASAAAPLRASRERRRRRARPSSSGTATTSASKLRNAMIAPRYVGPSTTTVSPGSRNDFATSSSASMPPLVTSSSSSAGRAPWSDSSRAASASRVPGEPLRRRVLERGRVACARRARRGAAPRVRPGTSAGRESRRRTRSGRDSPSSPRIAAIPSPAPARVRSAKSASQTRDSGVTAMGER